MSNFARPSLAEINSILRRHDALIVHFSGTPKGSGSSFEHAYPNDLLQVTGGLAQSGLSASVVMPNDEFESLTSANATGCIGVVLGLRTANSLVDAHPCDCGSRIEDGRRVATKARDMTEQDIEATITGRANDDYNEWLIAEYSVLGMFGAPPFRISTVESIRFPADMPDYLRTAGTAPGFQVTGLDEVARIFPDELIYSFVNGELVKYAEGQWQPVPHRDLYP